MAKAKATEPNEELVEMVRGNESVKVHPTQIDLWKDIGFEVVQ